MDNEQIKKTLEHFKEDGVSLRVRDIAYTLLSKMFVDNKIAYQCLFGTEEGYEDYSSDDARDKLEEYMTSEGFLRSVSTDADTGGITFEQNKKEMENLLAKTQQALTDGIIEPKDALKIMADIRVKLNDKFKVEASQRDRMIIVEKKFDFVCPHTQRECYQLDKEDAMQKWNLIEKPNDDGRQ
jgi:hypothetical protein